jgi:cytochrome c
MKITYVLMAAAALLGIGPDALASAELAKAKNCVACHAAAAKLVGPSFKDIAAKYAKDEGAPAKLAQKIQKGSQGVWGPIPMPPNPQVSNDEAAALTKWILGQG